ncbi:hypothetical protein Lser_V15G27549 [Lactuca serriola]
MGEMKKLTGGRREDKIRRIIRSFGFNHYKSPCYEIVPTCRELGIGIVAYSPLGRRFLSLGPKMAENLAEGDFRQNLPRFLPENLENNKMLYERVSAIAVKKGCTPSQLALAWVHHQGKDVVPIPGTTKIENLQQNIGALSVKLTPQDMAELESSLGIFIIGDGTNMYDFTYVENVAHAHICAERALASDGSVSKRAAGEFLAKTLDVVQDIDWVISLGNAFAKQYELYTYDDEHYALLHRAYFGAGLSGVLAWCVRVGRNQPNAPGVLAPSIFTSYVSRVLFNALAVFALREINLSKVTFSTTTFYLSR